MKQIQAYMISDGRIFDDKEVAEQEELILSFRREYDEDRVHSGVGWHDMLAWLCRHRMLVLEVLKS